MAVPGEPIAVTAAVIERDGRILIARCRDDDHLGGLWEFPGGKVETDETPEACLERELQEEFGVRSWVGEFVASNVHRYDHVLVEILAYRVALVEEDLRPTEHSEVSWVPVSQLQNQRLAPADVPIANALVRRFDDE